MTLFATDVGCQHYHMMLDFLTRTAIMCDGERRVFASAKIDERTKQKIILVTFFAGLDP
jgi:hypothetical protein